MKFTLIAIAALIVAVNVAVADTTVPGFKKFQLTDKFWAEGADFGDFNHDGVAKPNKNGVV